MLNEFDRSINFPVGSNLTLTRDPAEYDKRLLASLIANSL